mgnify:CR=1 FL=1
MDYMRMLDLEFGKYYRIRKESIEKAYQIALDELNDELAAYFATHGFIKKMYVGNSRGETEGRPAIIFQDFYKLSQDAVSRMKTEIRK